MKRNIQSLTLVVLVVLFGLFTKSAYSIKCYNCESRTNATCGNDFKPAAAYILDCSKLAPPRYLSNKNVTGCMKLITESEGKNIVKRSCLYGDPTDENYCQTKYLGSNEKMISCLPCKTELCNGAGAKFTAIATLTVFLAAIFGRILI